MSLTTAPTASSVYQAQAGSLPLGVCATQKHFSYSSVIRACLCLSVDCKSLRSQTCSLLANRENLSHLRGRFPQLPSTPIHPLLALPLLLFQWRSPCHLKPVPHRELWSSLFPASGPLSPPFSGSPSTLCISYKHLGSCLSAYNTSLCWPLSRAAYKNTRSSPTQYYSSQSQQALSGPQTRGSS